MLRLSFPLTTYSQSDVSLGGVNYRLTYRYNLADERWRIDVHQNETPILVGVKIMENASIIGVKYDTPLFNHGAIFCLRNLDDGLEAGRHNIGIGKAYELVYMTNEELADV